MMPEVDYVFAFLTGILGSFHCIGMCGGLVSAFFMRLGPQGALPYVFYHAGRIASYTLLGIIGASLGMVIAKAGIFGKIQGILQIIAGLLVIIIGLDLLRVLPWRLPFERLVVLPSRLFKRVTTEGPLFGALLGGVFNGFIPCSLVFAVAIKAVASSDPLQGGLLMIAFGLGTLPSMLTVSYLLGRIGARARGVLFRLAAYVVIVMGVNIVYEGVTYFWIMKDMANW